MTLKMIVSQLTLESLGLYSRLDFRNLHKQIPNHRAKMIHQKLTKCNFLRESVYLEQGSSGRRGARPSWIFEALVLVPQVLAAVSVYVHSLLDK